MKILLFLSCIVAVALACTNCGPPQDPAIPCGAPDCTLPENHQNNALFPHPDPNFYYQCYPTMRGWAPIARPCACGTVFNPHISPRRCSFWWESTWYPICEWQSPPNLAPCPTWCPDCGNGGATTTTTTQLPGGGETTTTLYNPDDQTTTSVINGEPQPPTPSPPPCVCPPPDDCLPCVWWPCVPCVPPPCLCNDAQQQIG